MTEHGVNARDTTGVTGANIPVRYATSTAADLGSRTGLFVLRHHRSHRSGRAGVGLTDAATADHSGHAGPAKFPPRGSPLKMRVSRGV